MIHLTIGNSYSRVIGLNPSQEAAVRKALSYSVPDPRGFNFRQTTRYLIDKRGNFPTGLLGHLKKALDVGGGQTDTRVRPTSLRLDLACIKLPFEPYNEQRRACSHALSHDRGTVVMPTGSGKSITMALLINQLQVRTLIVVPNLTLKRQLTESFLQYFGPTPNIVIENIDSRRLKTLTDFDCLIVDEAHHSAARTYRELNKKAWNSIYYRFFFTATPFRGREEEQILMESISGDVIYTLDYKTAVASGMILPIEAYYIELPKIPIKGRTWPQVYKEAVTHRQDRNEIIGDIICNLWRENKATLCLVKEILHGEILTNHGAWGFANGKDENTAQMLEEFAEGERGILIGTTGVCGEGVDTKACEYVIIAGLGKSKPQFMQQAGRSLRKFPGKDSAKIILIKDKSHKFTIAHFNAQCKILREEYNVTPAKLEI